MAPIHSKMERCNRLLKYCIRIPRRRFHYKRLGHKLCLRNKVYQQNFEICFAEQYSMIDRISCDQSTEVAKFFAYLLYTDSLSWHVLSCISLTEEGTTPNSRNFIRILFQELNLYLGIPSLNERLNDPVLQDSIASIFRKDLPKNTEYVIDFFFVFGLKGITNNLKEYYAAMQ